MTTFCSEIVLFCIQPMTFRGRRASERPTINHCNFKTINVPFDYDETISGVPFFFFLTCFALGGAASLCVNPVCLSEDVCVVDRVVPLLLAPGPATYSETPLDWARTLKKPGRTVSPYLNISWTEVS